MNILFKLNCSFAFIQNTFLKVHIYFYFILKIKINLSVLKTNKKLITKKKTETKRKQTNIITTV